MALTSYPWLQSTSDRLLELNHKLPNAVLLYGPSGLGTLELARQWAKSLLCEQPLADGSACNACPACDLVNAHTHPDLKYVVSEWVADRDNLPYTPPDSTARTKLSRQILIHQFRQLQDFLNLSANQGGRRVIIVYPADQIRQEAAASFLKAIEEPPEGLVYVLVADDIDKVLPTIRSRSRLIRVSIPPTSDTLLWLQAQAPFKRDKTGESARRKLAEVGGMPLDALGITNAFAMAEKPQEALLSVLSKGKDIHPNDILNLPVKDMTLPAVIDQLLRFVVDLRFVKVGMAPHYFVAYEEPMHSIVESLSTQALDTLYQALMPMSMNREHPFNARQAIEGLIITFRQHLTP